MAKLPVFSRRSLLQASVFAGISGSLAKNVSAIPKINGPKIHLKKGSVLLFQGDSITDARRKNRDAPIPSDQVSMGTGYASMIASTLLLKNPQLDLKIYNRGISGNKVHQLANRWDKECLAHKPNILSILIGVNDIWHGLQGKYDGTVQRYEDDYFALIERTRKALPKTQLVICEPFVLRCGAVNEKWYPEFDKYRESAYKIAQSSGARFVAFQSMFDQMLSYAQPHHWAGDGVHPTPHGSALMAEFWLRSVLA